MRPRLVGVAVVAGLVLALSAQLAWGEGSRGAVVRPNRITQLRVCGNNIVPFPGSQCTSDQRSAPITGKELDCSVRVYAGVKGALFTATMTYEGEVQYGFHERLKRGWHRELMGVYMHATAMPGGRYTCKFSLGKKRTAVSFRSGGPTGSVVGPAVCLTSHTKQNACTSDESGTPFGSATTPSITCTGVFPRLKGHPVEIDFLRLNADGTTTTLQRETDTLPYPITEEYAFKAGVWATPGQYSCRYLVDGTIAADKHFTVS